jgi:hypothetical protein
MQALSKSQFYFEEWEVNSWSAASFGPACTLTIRPFGASQGAALPVALSDELTATSEDRNTCST